MPAIKSALDRTQIDKILAQAQSRKTTHHPVSFLTGHIEEIAEAVKNKQSYVILEGRRFSITHKPYYGGCVHLNPDVGFVPCGYFSLSRLDNASKGDE